MADILSWALLITPWFLLLLLDLRRVKRFLSVAFFTLVLTSITWQLAETYDWWKIEHNLFFLTNISAFNYGFLPIATIFVFYFTYPNVWLFFGANLAMDAFQAFVVSPFIFEKIGLYQMLRMSDFGLFLLLYSMVPILYLYQRWYEKKE
ncbi:Hypothetical protein LUCI_1462 [Lucifera butyrica]|uniref:Lycopene cyclase domain-containing protein n=1 Tax=Lucifera butyrica TaxID=1351585 RepID=A0A498R492_9FIRM|nr:hypothetical protein [Lucifera butyrica]VBB06244.1 Hypothetical protein LUCI_1462 [Lucifera butyrica]